MCTALHKLSVCKQKIKADLPMVEEWVILGVTGVDEFVANYWCTYKPSKYFPPARALWYKLHQCPYAHEEFLVLPEDFSPTERQAWSRAGFAATIQTLVTDPSLTHWYPRRNYSDPSDPVYQALASMHCAIHHFTQHRSHIVDKYCFLWGLYKDSNDKTLHYVHQHMNGLYNWEPSMCPPDPTDPLEKMLEIVQLETYLTRQVNSSLDVCHASNVAVRGGSCIIMFHTRLPPYTDLHLFMQRFCKPIQELGQCWEKVVQQCPKESANSDMDVLIKLHLLACDLSHQNLSALWDIIYMWSSAVKKVEGSQVTIQLLAGYMHLNLEQQLTSSKKIVLPFASTLNMTLTTQPHIPPQMRSLLQQVAFYLDRINILQIYRYQGLSIMFALNNINRGLAVTIDVILYPLVELFLTEGGFIDYDPKRLLPWKN